ncbi:MAG: undecaprenyl-diphosphate phosphatase [Paracoccaceae bacterium]|nr:undecaprenyl-diphosphate phosphatase [Paracoccaceae bacterium]
MGFFYISILAVLQGITEFLPISSSGHLLLLSELFNQPEQTLQVDVAVHFGTLVAIILFYKKDFLSLTSGLHKNMTLRFNHNDAQFFRLILLATLPVIFCGLILKLTGLIHEIRSIKVIGIGMIIFGIILYISDKYGKKNRLKSDWTYKDAFIMGLWQTAALIPGTSRSGNTITGGMFLGFSRESAVNLSLIMSIPTILASSVLLSLDFIAIELKNSDLKILLLGAFFSFLAARLTLSLLVRFVKTYSFTPFVIYRLILGLSILYISYT